MIAFTTPRNCRNKQRELVTPGKPAYSMSRAIYKIIFDGNVPWISDKNFGIGTYQSAARFRPVRKREIVYTFIVRSKEVCVKPEFISLLKNGNVWVIKGCSISN